MTEYASSRWTTVSSGTMNDTDQTKRLYVVQFVDMYANSENVYWSDDGTISGTTLFSSSLMPYVKVMVSPRGNEREWFEPWRVGPVIRDQYMTGLHMMCWATEWDSTNSVWWTRVAHRGTDSGGNDYGGENDLQYVAMVGALGLG